MILSPSLGKAALLAHIICSVSWMGAVAAFLALAITGMKGIDPVVVRAAYLVMEPITWYVIFPFALTSLLTGGICPWAPNGDLSDNIG